MCSTSTLIYDADFHEICALENLWRANIQKARYVSAVLIFYRKLPLSIIDYIINLSYPVSFVTSVSRIPMSDIPCTHEKHKIFEVVDTKMPPICFF